MRNGRITKDTTTLPGKVESAPSGAIGFDTNTVVTKDTATNFLEDGYTFCIRYVARRDSSKVSNDLSNGEASDILAAGLALMVVQHVEGSGWSPTGALGTEYGANAARYAEEIGIPEGVNLWLDLEGVLSGTAASDVISYCNNWYDEVSNAGYVPGIYVGYSTILTGSQLYYNLKFQHYWQATSSSPEVAVRGYQLFQSGQNSTVNGIQIDKDTARTDNSGGQAQWLIDSK